MLLLMWNCCATRKSIDWSKSHCQQISQNNCFTYHTNDRMKFEGNTLGKYTSPDYLQHCHQIIFIDIKRIRGIPRCPVEDWQDNLVAVHWLCTIGKVPICWLCILITWLATSWVILCGNDHLQKKKIDSLVDDIGHHANARSQSHHHHHSWLDPSVQVAHLWSYCAVPCQRWCCSHCHHHSRLDPSAQVACLPHNDQRWLGWLIGQPTLRVLHNW